VAIGLTRFLWATTNPRGDYTADPLIRLHDSVEREWQAGVFHLVTFTMAPEDFLTWSKGRVGRSAWGVGPACEAGPVSVRRFRRASGRDPCARRPIRLPTAHWRNLRSICRAGPWSLRLCRRNRCASICAKMTCGLDKDSPCPPWL